MTEKKGLFSCDSANLYLFLNSGYLSGVIFLGAQVLLSVRMEMALLLSVLTFLAYLFVVKFFTFLIRAFFSDIRSSYRSAILVACLTTALMIPYSVLLSYLSIYTWAASSKYYFYWLVAAEIVFATTLIYGYVFKQTAVRGKNPSKLKFTLSLELVKSTLWILVFFVFGTAYAQVLLGTPINYDEMFMIFYTSVGFVVFVVAPLMVGLADTLDQIDSGETCVLD
jgi:hypothetical protein